MYLKVWNLNSFYESFFCLDICEDLWEAGAALLHSPPAATSEDSNFRPPAWLAQWPLPLVISAYEVNIALYLVILPTL